MYDRSKDERGDWAEVESLLRRRKGIVLTMQRSTPELAAAVGIAGHNRGGRHAAWISRRSRKGFIGTTVGGGDLSWILVEVGSIRAFKS